MHCPKICGLFNFHGMQKAAPHFGALLSVSKKWLRPLFRVFARGWRRAAAPILRSRAGGEPPLPYCAPALGRLYAEKQRKYGRPDTGPAGRPALEKCKKPRTGRGFLRIYRGRADDPFRYIGFSTVCLIIFPPSAPQAGQNDRWRYRSLRYLQSHSGQTQRECLPAGPPGNPPGYLPHTPAVSDHCGG